MSGIAGGFSLERISGRNLFWIGIGLVVLVAVVGDMLGFVRRKLAGPPPVPACYNKYSAFYTRGTKALLPRGTPASDARNLSQVVRMKDVSRICTAKACDADALKAYRDALHWYLAGRTFHMRKLDIESGDAGLARARELYRTPDDLEIEQGLRERYQARVFWINEGSADEDVLRILLFKGADALRPCRKSDAG